MSSPVTPGSHPLIQEGVSGTSFPESVEKGSLQPKRLNSHYPSLIRGNGQSVADRVKEAAEVKKAAAALEDKTCVHIPGDVFVVLKQAKKLGTMTERIPEPVSMNEVPFVPPSASEDKPKEPEETLEESAVTETTPTDVSAKKPEVVAETKPTDVAAKKPEVVAEKKPEVSKEKPATPEKTQRRWPRIVAFKDLLFGIFIIPKNVFANVYKIVTSDNKKSDSENTLKGRARKIAILPIQAVATAFRNFIRIAKPDSTIFSNWAFQ